MSESLVQSTKLFLEKYIQKQRLAYPDRDPVVSISLSGGLFLPSRLLITLSS